MRFSMEQRVFYIKSLSLEMTHLISPIDTRLKVLKNSTQINFMKLPFLVVFENFDNDLRNMSQGRMSL